MSRHTARAGQDRTSLYQEITDKIIAELEAGRVPWVQPWATPAANASLAMPKNAASGRRYSGINVLILWGAVIERGFSCQRWLTFRQALGLGGHVRRGERGTTVVYADRFIPDGARRRAEETGEEAQAIPFLKRFTVFNPDQCDDLPADIASVTAPLPPGLVEPRAEALIAATGADFRIGGTRAFYSPPEDFVQVCWGGNRMGLDAVEIVLAVEEKFGIAIPDEVAEKIATPGEMTDYVFHKIQHPDASSCLSQRAFHLLRRAWMVNLQTPRNLFCLDTGVDHIVPRENRRHLWADLGRQVGAVSWPALQRSEVLVAGLCIVTIATFVAMYLLGAHALGWGSGLPVLVAVGSCALLGWGVTVATRPLKTAIPSRFRDIRDLVEYMVARNPQIAKTDEKKWTRGEVWCIVREIVIEQTGVHDFTEKSHFVKDIGIN